MTSTKPGQRVLIHGFPAAFEELRQLPIPIEPDLVLGLYVLLQGSGLRLDYSDADVLSGQASKFLYRFEHPECAELSFVPPVDTLFRALRICWHEVTPSDPETAWGVAKKWILSGHLVLARFAEPLVIYGIGETGQRHFFYCGRPASGLTEEEVSIPVCSKRYWRQPVDEGNVLFVIEEAPEQTPEVDELLYTVARRAAGSWHTAELAGCYSGEAAYRALADDLNNETLDFTQSRASKWMGTALWKQWTARYSMMRFFLRAAPRYGGNLRKTVERVSFYYEQCVEAWKKWAVSLGPTWNRDRIAFPAEYPIEYIERWTSISNRRKAAACVLEACEWEGKAVREQTKILG